MLPVTSHSEIFLGEYQDTFANLRQVLVQKTFIKTMLDNDGDPNASPGFGPEKLSTENVNFLVSIETRRFKLSVQILV